MVPDKIAPEGGATPLHEKLLNALIKHYFSTYTNWNENSIHDSSRTDEVSRQLHRRYDEFKDFYTPWLARHCPLSEINVLEIGCGTGSSAAALAPHVKSITGFDIHKGAVGAANARFEILGLNNVKAIHNSAENSLPEIDATIPDQSVEMVLIYAVLEHQTIQERLDTLELVWRKLKPNGFLVIGETPNRLTYFDIHTSKMSFFHLLPLELQAKYYQNSSREGFVNSLNNVAEENLPMALTRWGQSISYHELEIVYGRKVHGLIVGHGHDPEIVKLRPYRIEEKYLNGLLSEQQFKINIGFSRHYLDLIIKKTDKYKWDNNFSKIPANIYESYLKGKQ